MGRHALNRRATAQAVYRASRKGRAGILVKSARARARSAGVPFDLTVQWALAQLERGACAATGVPFELTAGKYRARTNPFAPSIDRVVPEKGYVKGNVRMVVWIYNVMRLDYGDAAVARFLEALK